MSDGRAAVRKRLGQYYTPESEAASFAAWAIRSGTERILEPSVGDGALLIPAIRRARALSGDNIQLAVACDVDASTIETLKPVCGRDAELIGCSFFDLGAETTGTFDVVLANPPFTRNHEIEANLRRLIRARYPVKGAAGLWAYFVLHAMSMLRPSGRMAIVVPASAGFSDYSADLLGQLREHFGEVALYDLPTKPVWVGGAEERGSLLLAEDFGEGPTPTIKRGVWNYNGVPAPTVRCSSSAFGRLQLAARPLGAIADLSIGVVTGCNRSFLLSKSEVDESGIAPSDLVPVITRARQVRGAFTTSADLAALAGDGEKTWLLAPQVLGEHGGAVRRRLATINARTRRATAWLNKRSPWWKVDLGLPCDAVFTYMNDFGPRLSLTGSGIYCTNTLHRVRFKPETSNEERFAAVLSLYSTFGQLFAEAIGRGYSGGLLKFELREARALPVLPVSASITTEVMEGFDAALRAGEHEQARAIADHATVAPVLGRDFHAQLEELENTLRIARTSRRHGAVRLFEF